MCAEAVGGVCFTHSSRYPDIIASVGSGSPSDRSLCITRMYASVHAKNSRHQRAHASVVEAVRRAILVVKLGEGRMLRAALEHVLSVVSEWEGVGFGGKGGHVVARKDDWIWRQANDMNVRELKEVLQQRGAKVVGLVRKLCVSVFFFCVCMYICT